MKTKLKLIALCCLVSALCLSASAQGTAFTYQGRLNDGANPAGGIYDLRFAIYDSLSAGIQQGGLLTNSATAVSNGLFTVVLDFGNGLFSGADRWLEIGVRTNGAGTFSTLSPRQKISPTPYAIFAGTVSTNGLAPGTYANAVNLNNAGNSFSGSGTGLLNVNATTFGGQGATNFWQLGGNNLSAVQFLGSTNNQALEFRVNGRRAVRIEPGPDDFSRSNMPNVIAGSALNYVSPTAGGATVAGGAGYASSYAASNSVLSDFGTISGGAGNLAVGYASTVPGGWFNTAGGFASTAMGSVSFTDYGSSGALAAGLGAYAGGAAAISLGYSNSALGNYSFAGGNQAKANHPGTFVWADSVNAPFISTGSDQFLIRATGGVGIGTTNPLVQLAVNGNTRIDAQNGAYSEGLVLNCPPDMGGFGALHFHNAPRGGALNGGTVKWDIFYNYAPEGSGGGGLAFSQNNSNTRLYLGTNGNVGIGTTSPSNKLHVVGGVSATVFVTMSDRNAKENIAPISSRDILEKVTALPVTQWSFRELPGSTHIGPMAQDFYAAFGLGAGNTGIATVDADGVALAAIQGLNEKVEGRSQKSDYRIQKLEAENAELKQRLDALEKIIRNQTPN